MPRVVGKIQRKHPVEVRDLKFLRANTDRKIKITLPGPFTMSQQAQNDFYKSEEEMVLDYAAAVNAEIKDLFAAGADVVQLDEPWMEAHAEKARTIGLSALRRALEGVKGTTALHICFGYAAMVPGRPAKYSFLEELADSPVQQISIETAQASLDYGGAGEAAGEDDHSRRDRSFEARGGNAGDGGGADSAGAAVRESGAAGRGAGLRDEVFAGGIGVREIEVARGRCGDRAERTGWTSGGELGQGRKSRSSFLKVRMQRARRQHVGKRPVERVQAADRELRRPVLQRQSKDADREIGDPGKISARICR